MNTWEACALEYRYPERMVQGSEAKPPAWGDGSAASDPIIYPGLYCPSGFDMLNILFRVAARPSPKVTLGAIDCSCALLLCDLAKPDTPIVYASEPFSLLTGYSNREVIGRNCRFLQAPDGQVRQGTGRKYVDKQTVKRMKRAVEKNEELQIEVVNFKKDGTRFVNLLTMIPVRWDSQDYRYCVGFQVELEE